MICYAVVHSYGDNKESQKKVPVLVTSQTEGVKVLNISPALKRLVFYTCVCVCVCVCV